MDTKDEYGIWSQTPLNLGWLQRKLNPTEINHLWDCVKNKGGDTRHKLAGNISGSYEIPDENNWFFAYFTNRIGNFYFIVWCTDYLSIYAPNKFNLLS